MESEIEVPHLTFAWHFIPPLPPRLNVVDGTGRLDARWTRQHKKTRDVWCQHWRRGEGGVYIAECSHMSCEGYFCFAILRFWSPSTVLWQSSFLVFLILVSLDMQNTCRRAMSWTHEQACEHGVFPWPVGDTCLDNPALTPLFRIDILNVVHM